MTLLKPPDNPKKRSKGGKASPAARQRANRRYYEKYQERLKAEARIRYWTEKLAEAAPAVPAEVSSVIRR